MPDTSPGLRSAVADCQCLVNHYLLGFQVSGMKVIGLENILQKYLVQIM